MKTIIDAFIKEQATRSVNLSDIGFMAVWAFSTALNSYFYYETNIELDLTNVSQPIRDLANLGKPHKAMPDIRAIASIISTANLLLIAVVLLRDTYQQRLIQKKILHHLRQNNDPDASSFELHSNTQKIIWLTAIGLAAGIPMAASDFREFSNNMNSTGDIIANIMQFIGMYILYTIIHILPADIIYQDARLFSLSKILTPLVWPFYGLCKGVHYLHQGCNGTSTSTTPTPPHQISYIHWLRSEKTNQKKEALSYLLPTIASLGALWSTLGNSGYPMAAFDLAWNLFPNAGLPIRLIVTYLLAVGPAFIVSTLIFEKAYHLFSSIGKQLSKLIKGQFDFPLMMQLFPIPYLAFIAGSLLISLLSFGAALAVILKNYYWVNNEGLTTTLEWMAVGKGFFFLKCNIYAFDWAFNQLCRQGFIGDSAARRRALKQDIRKYISKFYTALPAKAYLAIVSKSPPEQTNNLTNTTLDKRSAIQSLKYAEACHPKNPASYALYAYLLSQLAQKSIWLAAGMITTLKNPRPSTKIAILIACTILSMPVVVTQLILTYSKQYPGHYAKHQNIRIINTLIQGRWTRGMLILSPFIEMLALPAISIFYWNYLAPNNTMKIIVTILAALIALTRYAKTTMAHSHEALNYINQQRQAAGMTPVKNLRSYWPAAIMQAAYKASPLLEVFYQHGLISIIHRIFLSHPSHHKQLITTFFSIIWGITLLCFPLGYYCHQLFPNKDFHKNAQKHYGLARENQWKKTPSYHVSPAWIGTQICRWTAKKYYHADTSTLIYFTINVAIIAAHLAQTAVLPLVIDRLFSQKDTAIKEEIAIPLMCLIGCLGWCSGRLQCSLSDRHSRKTAIDLGTKGGTPYTTIQYGSPLPGLNPRA